MDISSLCSSSLSLPSVTAAEQKALEAKKQNASTAKTHKSILNMKQSKHKHGTLYQQHHKNTKLTYKMSSFVGHGGPVWCCDFEGDRLVSGSYDKTIKV